MTTTLVVPTEPHVGPLPNNQEPVFQTWKVEGERLVGKLNSSKDAYENSQWAVGDWLVDGEKKFGEKAYKTAEEITGWKRGTLYNIVWVVKSFPTPSLRSETDLKWSHFKELAELPEGSREEALQHFNDGFPHSVRDIRIYVDSVLRKVTERKEPERPGSPKNFVYLQVSLKPNVRDLVKKYAKAKGKHPDVLLREIVTEYFKKNKPDIE